MIVCETFSKRSNASPRRRRSGRASFDADEKIRVWVVYHLQIIGEVAAKYSDDVRKTQKHVPWSRIIRMRNTLVHHYFEIDDELVWETVQRDLTDLRSGVSELLASLEAAGREAG